MARVPAAGVMVTSPKDQAVLQAEEEQRRKSIEQMLGAADDVTYTIASGAFKPTVGVFAVDTEGAASTDDLDRITGEPDVTLAGFPGHGIALLRAAHTDRTVVVKHLAGGSYDISLAFGATFALDNDRKSIALQLRGTRWYEIDRDYGGDFAARRADLGVTKLAQLANPANPGDDGKYVGASSGNVAWTLLPQGGDGFRARGLYYEPNDALYQAGSVVRFGNTISGTVGDGYTFNAPGGSTFCRVQCMAEIERDKNETGHGFVKLKVETKRQSSTGGHNNAVVIVVYDETGLIGARGLAARTVFYRTGNDADLTPYVAIASSIVPVIANGAVRIRLMGTSGNDFTVKGGRSRAWLSLQWI